MRILFHINNLKTAGMRFVLADIVSGLVKSTDYKITINVNHKTNSDLENELSKLVEVTNVVLNYDYRPYFRFLKNVFKVRRQLKGKYDLVHSFSYYSNLAEVLVFYKTKARYIMEKTNLNFNNKFWRLKVSLSDHIICLSTAQMDQLTSSKSKVSMIPTGIDLNVFKKNPDVTKSACGLPENSFIIISIANITPVKGHKDLVEALHELGQRHNIYSVFAGRIDDNGYIDELKALIESKDLTDKIRITGSLDPAELVRLLSVSDLKILATRNFGPREALGAALLEAMACGVCVIGTKSGGPSDIIKNEINGLIIEPEGSAPIVQAIERLIKDTNLRNQLASKGYLDVKEHYTKSIMIEKYKNTYSRVWSGNTLS